MFATTLKDIKEAMKPKEGGGDFQKIEWLHMEDGDAFTIRFANELDEDSPSYNKANGVTVIVPEHGNQDSFPRKIACTAGELGDQPCYGCELARDNPKAGWWPKNRWYVNVLVDDGKKEPYIAVWSRTASQRTEFADVADEFFDTGSITNKEWKIKRRGVKKDTSYPLVPKGPDIEPFDWSGYELFNLEQVVPNIEYDKQRNFLFPGSEDAVESNTDVPWDKDDEATNVQW